MDNIDHLASVLVENTGPWLSSGCYLTHPNIVSDKLHALIVTTLPEGSGPPSRIICPAVRKTQEVDENSKSFKSPQITWKTNPWRSHFVTHTTQKDQHTLVLTMCLFLDRWGPNLIHGRGTSMHWNFCHGCSIMVLSTQYGLEELWRHSKVFVMFLWLFLRRECGVAASIVLPEGPKSSGYARSVKV